MKMEAAASTPGDPVKTEVSMGSATGNPRNKTALAPGHSLMDWIRLGSSGLDLTGVGGRHQTVTLPELAKHNQRNDAWIAIRGTVFNVTRYMDYHPGGVPELMKGVGRDATKLFEDVHAWVNYQSILQKCVVGRLCRAGGTEGQVTPRRRRPSSSSMNPPEATATPSIETDWKQTTNTVTFVYKASREQFSSSFQLARQNDKEFWIEIQLPDAVIKHEYSLNEAVQWPPTWRRNFDSMQLEFTFTKAIGKLWNFYGDRVVNVGRRVERCYKDWEIVSNTALCDAVRLLVLRCNDYMEIVPVGRHIEVKMTVGGMEVSRAYTPVPPSLHPNYEAPVYKSNCLCLMIKRYDDGALTPSITALQPGQFLTMSNGLGSFVVESFDDYTRIHMIAAGSGLTPMLGIIQRSLSRRNMSSINLMNFNRNEESIFYREELERVRADERLNVVHVLSQAGESWTGRRGVVSDELIEELIGGADSRACIFVCGPKAFMTAARAALLRIDWSPSQIHEFDG